MMVICSPFGLEFVTPGSSCSRLAAATTQNAKQISITSETAIALPNAVPTPEFGGQLGQTFGDPARGSDSESKLDLTDYGIVVGSGISAPLGTESITVGFAWDFSSSVRWDLAPRRGRAMASTTHRDLALTFSRDFSWTFNLDFALTIS
jgi:hypothetical protein